MDRYLTCKEVLDFLDDYLDGGQPAEVRTEFERHLAVCPMCRDYLQSYTSTVKLVAQLGSPNAAEAEVPEDLVRAILTAQSRRDPPP